MTEHRSTRLSRRTLLGAAAATAAGIVAAPVASLATAPTPAGADTPDAATKGPFVRVAAGQFQVGGKPWRFAGTNCYYLHQQSHYMIDSVLDDAGAMSLAVVRAWAFADGTGPSKPLQPRPYVYDDAAFDSLDYAVWKAGQLGLRLVLPLVNNWPDYGGMRQYVQWFLGLPDDSYGDAVNHDRFYTDPQIRACYRAWAQHVVTRRNRYTGLTYNQDPTVMTFELANEPRNRSDKTGAGVQAWVREMSAYVKGLAPRQLVAVGDEGFYGDAKNSDYPYSNYEGNRWRDLVSLPAVDYGTVHLYPQGWGEISAGKPGTDPVTWGRQWINAHLGDAARLGKPVVIEEYGLNVDPAKDVPDEATRDAAYQSWITAIENHGGSDQFWILTSRVDDGSYYPDYDGYRIVWRSDDTNVTDTAAHQFATHAARMRQL